VTAHDTDGGDDLEHADVRGVSRVADRRRAHAERAPGGRAGARWPIFLALSATVVVADQLAKAWLVSTVRPGGALPVVGDYLRLINTQNTGALFGLFRDQAVLFGLASLAVIALIVVYHARAGRSTYLSVALGLLLGGAIGNLIDRLRLGYVVDFVDMGIGDVRFYTYNVADAAISTAILLLLLLSVVPALGGSPDTSDGAATA